MPTESALPLRGRMAGVFAPISTPFSDDEEVDYKALTFNVERYAATGLLGYLALGSNGENRSLTESERLAVLRPHHRAQARRPGGDGRRGLRRPARRRALSPRSRRHGRRFRPGAFPGYFRKQMTDDVLFRYFSTLAETVPIPLVLYNAPGSAASRSRPRWWDAWRRIPTSWA